MTDAELSRKFGRYQIMESIGILGDALCVIIASILAFVQHDLTIFAILFFAGVAIILLAALAGIFLSRRSLHKGTPIRMICIISCMLLTAVCAAYIVLALMLVTAVQ